jgi:hypothetical protein
MGQSRFIISSKVSDPWLLMKLCPGFNCNRPCHLLRYSFHLVADCCHREATETCVFGYLVVFLILVWFILLRLCLTKITSQLPLFATYLVFTVHNITPHYMFRRYCHLQVCYIYINAKITLKLNGYVNLVSK